jgi:hypothetical protein
MKAGRLVACVVALCLASSRSNGARGDPPDLLRSYQFLPGHSTLSQTGGIAGIDVRFAVHGTFDLVTGWEYRPDPPPKSIHAFARFENVDAWAHTLSDIPPIDLDLVLNLSELKGSQLPVAAPFDVYQFEGKSSDGSAVNLHASVLGNWLYLRGVTEPPPNSADFFVYQINALARQLPYADFNQDDAVDSQDLEVWAGGFGQPPISSSDSLLSGDADANGMVDGADFLHWQRQLGDAPPKMASFVVMVNAAPATSAVVAAVPESRAIGLAILGMAALFARCHREARRSHNTRMLMSCD